jgi:GDP-L-fucose synthase
LVATRKRLLVTGVTGVLGSAFPRLAERYPHYEFIFAQRDDLDLTEFPAVVDFLRRGRVDRIMHLAALSGGIEFTKKYPAQILRDNLLMTLNVLEAARFQKLDKVVLTLSSGMYPEDAPQPYREQSIHAGAPHGSNESYAFAKRLIEPAIKAYRVQYGLNAIGLVPRYLDSRLDPALLRVPTGGRRGGGLGRRIASARVDLFGRHGRGLYVVFGKL